MNEERRQARQREARRLMRALTGGREQLVITEGGEISAQPLPPPDNYHELVTSRQREYEILAQQQRELLAQGRRAEAMELAPQVSAAFDRTLQGVADALQVSYRIGENERLEHQIYETVMRLPDDVRAFMMDRVVFLSSAWGQAFRGVDWSQQWVIVLAPDLPDDDATGIIAHEIAHAWRGHGTDPLGYTADEEREACALAQCWGFTGAGTVFQAPPPEVPESTPITYIN
jgi:hypothetical protein